MKKTLWMLAGLLLMPSMELHAVIKDTVSVNIREYKDEEGFFQKANRDLGDPHFMFKDSSLGIEFGIGGTAKIAAYYGFGGEVENTSFKPSFISVPTDYAPGFGTKISSSEIHFKARMQLGKRKMSAYVKLGGKPDNSLEIKQAYLSYGGFSVGLIPTFFTDLEVGVMTTGVGQGTQVDFDHTLFGYTHRIDEHWTVAAALENAKVNLDNFSPETHGVYTNYQPLPDIVAHVKYKWDYGHFQFGALYRNLTYWTFQYPVKYNADGENRHVPGFGFAVSGNVNPTSKLRVSYELAAGRGISAYLDNISGQDLELGLCGMDSEGYRTMSAIPVASGQIALQYNWAKEFSSSFIASFSHRIYEAGVECLSAFRNSTAITANFFWNMNDYAYMGLEYLFGAKHIYATQGSPDFGVAHRIVYVVAYCF